MSPISCLQIYFLIFENLYDILSASHNIIKLSICSKLPSPSSSPPKIQSRLRLSNLPLLKSSPIKNSLSPASLSPPKSPTNPCQRQRPSPALATAVIMQKNSHQQPITSSASKAAYFRTKLAIKSLPGWLSNPATNMAMAKPAASTSLLKSPN